MSSAKWRPFCLGLNVLNDNGDHTNFTTSPTTSHIVNIDPNTN